MGVSIIHDPISNVACLHCTTSDFAFGPVFTGDDPEGQADHFLEWFSRGDAEKAAALLGIIPSLLGRATDPRFYSESDLERLHTRWLSAWEQHVREYA